MEKVTLRLFWTCMIACASCAVIGIWFEERVPEAFFKAMATLFIIGLANFLVWAPMMVYRFLNKQPH